MNKLNHTQSLALAHLHNRLKDFLFNYAEGGLQPDFFFQGMEGIIGEIDTFIRENGQFSCNYVRHLKIHEKFLEKA